MPNIPFLTGRKRKILKYTIYNMCTLSIIFFCEVNTRTTFITFIFINFIYIYIYVTTLKYIRGVT